MNDAVRYARRIVREALQLNPAGVEWLFGIRCTLGVAIPLIVALVSGQRLSGVSAAIGAVVVGFASRQGVYRTRAAAMLFSALGTAVSAFVGSITGESTALSIAIGALWGLAFGVLASLGNAATTVGVNSIIALAIFGQFHFTPLEALEQALFVFAGGALQTLLLVAVWPLQRFSAERKVLASAYRALADYVGHIAQSELQSPDPATLTQVSVTLADPQPFARRGETVVFELLLSEAERIRASLAALATDRYLFASQRMEHALAAVQTLADGAALVLGDIAAGLERAEAPANDPPAWTAIDAAVATLEHEREVARSATEGRLDTQTVADARALAGQLRAAWHAGRAPVDRSALPRPVSRTAQMFHPAVIGEAFKTLRANCTLDSAYGRHALRLAVVMMVSEAAAHLLPIQRGYWIALTAVLVLKPDFGTTFSRGIARVVGTVVGALVASAFAFIFHPSAEVAFTLAILAAGAGYVLFNVSYAVYTVTVTMYVVFLLAFGGLSEETAIVDRVGSSLIGGMLALIAYLAWPLWEREKVPDQLANLLSTVRAYSRLVFDAYLVPETRDDGALHDAQTAVRLARTNAEASVDRLLNEPVHPRAVTVRAALGILSASRRYGLATLTLQSRLYRASLTSHAALAAFSGGLDDAMGVVIGALHDRTAPLDLPPIRELHAALTKTLETDASSDVAALVSETDLLADSVNTIADLLRRMRQPSATTPSADDALVSG